MTRTPIEWVNRPQTGKNHFSWNPIRVRFKDDAGNVLVGWACTHASTGCLNCYAEAINKRFGTGLPFSVPALERVEFFLNEKELQAPLRVKKPATIFVGDMFDLFHEKMPLEMIAQVLWIAGCCKDRHTMQFLTKRADRMQEIMSTEFAFNHSPLREWAPSVWPLPNVWLGVSCENQKYADERIPLLLQTPAAVRFVSVEPQLEEIDFSRWLKMPCGNWPNAILGDHLCSLCRDFVKPGIHQFICGGESGPHARPFNLAWAESLRDQCKAAGVSFFMKQFGSNPYGPVSLLSDADQIARIVKADRKGGMSEHWPESLRIREWPA